MMTTVTEMMAPQLYELQYGHYTFYNLTDGHHTKCLNLKFNQQQKFILFYQ